MHVAGFEFDEIKLIPLSSGEDERGRGVIVVRSDYGPSVTGFTAAQVAVIQSGNNVLRGPHLAVGLKQSKLIGCVEGEIYDVVVDCRQESRELGRWGAYVLSGDSPFGLFVPPGFAHGYLSRSARSLVAISIDAAGEEVAIDAFDPSLGITWPGVTALTAVRSSRDRGGELFSNLLG